MTEAQPTQTASPQIVGVRFQKIGKSRKARLPKAAAFRSCEEARSADVAIPIVLEGGQA